MKVNKKERLLFLSLFSIVLTLSFLSAVVTLQDPSASDVLVGIAVTWNVTNSSDNFGTGMTFCRIWASSSSTANSTAINISEYSNTSIAALFINGSMDTTVGAAYLEDASDYSFFASCGNSTASAETNSSTVTVTIDNSAPTAGTSLSPAASSIDTDGSVTFSATVVGENTTACTLYFPTTNPGSSSYVMTHSGDSCTITRTVAEQTYSYIIGASDGRNETNTSSTAFQVDVPAGGIPLDSLEYIRQQEAQDKRALSVGGGMNIGGIPAWVIVAIAVIVIVIVINRRK